MTGQKGEKNSKMIPPDICQKALILDSDYLISLFKCATCHEISAIVITPQIKWNGENIIPTYIIIVIPR